MIFYIAVSLLSLILILISCEFFTNSIEWTGEKFNLNEGITGSILAAVGTALPETIIPIIALIFIPGEKGSEIGIGAILGAPFMLSTLAFGVTGIAVVFYYFTKKRSLWLSVNNKILSNDIFFFIIAYILAISTSYITDGIFKKFSGIIFILIYALYVYITFLHEKEEKKIELSPLYFGKSSNPSILLVILQDIVSLAGMVVGAKFFVSGIENLSQIFNISPFIFSLFIAPIATELPEKFNSIIWIGKQKDTLALGNISGAMIFQSSIVVAVGIIGTNWILNNRAIVSAVIALLSSLIIATFIKIFKKLHAIVLINGVILYILYIIIILNFVK